jgi:hypothetical protein
MNPNSINSKEQHYCIGCNRIFNSSRAISSHWQQNKECSDTCNLQRQDFQNNDICSNNFDAFDNNNRDDEDSSSIFVNEEQNDSEQTDDEILLHHNTSTFSSHFLCNSKYNNLAPKIELLKILNTAKAPLYLYENIMSWAKHAVNKHDMDFSTENNISRDKLIQELKFKHDLSGIEPLVKSVCLHGSGSTVDIVTQSFKASLYSLLNDKKLMQKENLLITADDIYNPDNEMQTTSNSNKYYGDINTGTAYFKAKKEYLTNPGDLLCPIIFFIDKTHTDINGRLCLEPIRFTLGIFNRETRNNPSAWRTIGYITDQAQIPKTTAHQKAKDYHHMMEVLLEEFIQCQADQLPFKLILSIEESYNVNLKIPVLFIIGDTEGLDKICGRYTSRNNIQRPCRCCNITFRELDNPEYKFKYNNHKNIMKQVRKDSKEQLKNLSMQKLTNAWEKVQFCDSDRGLFGAVSGDIMHCLQHGLFMYLITILFDQKKIKDTTNSETNNIQADILSNRSAFPEVYRGHFDRICRDYGKKLMHQSDRTLPRTHFYSNYTTVTRKNASEMTGILLVYLMVFNSNEGESNIDKQLGEGRTAKFIHLFELMLLLENFCNQEELSSSMVRTLHKFMPYLLNTFKIILDRQVGCQMKIIKFHLPIHFAGDIQRFGSMKNFDTGIGESHHKTEAKIPAKNTQRRRINFEYQTAKRQVENLAIHMAYSHSLKQNNSEPTLVNNEECKWYRYIFDVDDLILKNRKESKETCKWKDNQFQAQLQKICIEIVNQKCIVGNFQFFTQHNRAQSIFRADPSYEKNDPWYDWASIKWEQDGIIPAKLMLFWDIKSDQFKKPFKIGSTTVNSYGTYAISYSLSSSSSTIKAHGMSQLVKYAKLNFETDICIFPLESIHSPITALPFRNNEDIITAKEWIFLVSKASWKQIFFDLMKSQLEKEKSTMNRKKRKL